MRLHSLEVDTFRIVVNARLKFGGGLNVLFGANDTGKSTLVDALRAALLVSVGGSDAQSFRPWGTDATPRAVVEFESKGSLYRVTKSFGLGARGQALLQHSERFITLARGRDVEGKLRELLSWGVPPPGGKGQQRRTTAYLTTALLGRQGEVGSILEANIEQDLEESGRRLVTQALDALGQDPLVGKLVERLKQETDEVFNADGTHRRRADSPLVLRKKEIEARERRLRELEESARRSDEVQQQVQALVATRDQKAQTFELARSEMEWRMKATEAAKERSALDKKIEIVAKEIERAAEATAALVRAKQEIEEARAGLETCETEYSRANEVLLGAEKIVQPIRTRVANAKAAAEQSGELAQRSLESRQTTLVAEREAATRRAGDARELERVEGRVRDLAGKLEDNREAQVEAKQRLERAVAIGRLVDLRAKHGEARALIDTLREAEREQARCAELEASSRAGVEAAEAALESARRDLEVAREQASVSERVLPEQTLKASLLQSEASYRAAQGLVLRVSEVVDANKRSVDAERELVDLEERLQALGVKTDANKSEIDAGAARIRECDRMALALRRRAVRQQIETLDQQATLSREARAEAATLRSRAKQMEATRPRPISSERLAEFRRLSEQIESPPPRPTKPPVLSTLLFGVAAGALTWVALTFIARVGSAEIIAVVAAIVVATIRVLVQRTLNEAPGREWRAQHDLLRKRWANEVEPALQEGRVADLGALEEACRRVENEAREAERLRAEADDHDKSADGAQSASLPLGSLRLELDGLEWMEPEQEIRLQGEATTLGGREALSRELARLRLDAERLREERARILEDRNAALSIQQTARARVETTRSERERANSIVPDPIAAREEAEARLVAEQSQIDAIREQLAAFGASTSSAISEAAMRLGAAEAQLSQCSETVEAKRADHSVNTRKASAASVRREIAARGAQAVDLEKLDIALAEFTQLLGSDVGDNTNHAAEAAVLAARQRVTELSTEFGALNASVAEARTRAHELASFLGAPGAEVLAAAEQAISRIATELGASSDNGDAVRKAASELDEAAEQLVHAEARTLQTKTDEQAARVARDEARARFERARGDVEARAQAAVSANRAEAALELSEMRSAVAGMPSVSAPAAHEIDTARQELERREQELRRVESELQQARGELKVVGGMVAAEQRDDEREALTRLCESRDELELNYAAARLLLTTLEEAEGRRAQHLGRCLAKPVTERFLDLTRGRYGAVNLDRGLCAQGIVAVGEARELDTFSMGTREQVATLVRLAVAAQIKSLLVLDDQLVQSDPERLSWFRAQLRASVREHGHQIVVVTCRPNDYVATEELPAPGQDRFVSADGMLTTINLDHQLARRAEKATNG